MQGQLPLWVHYVQALGPSIVAVVAAFIAGYIAWRQWRTAHERLRLEMFDRRVAVYDATKLLLTKATIHGQVLPDDFQLFYSGIRSAEFLFDGAMRDLIMRIANMCVTANIARSQMARSPEHPRFDQLIEKEEQVLAFLRNQDQQLERIFAPYVDLSRIGLRGR